MAKGRTRKILKPEAQKRVNELLRQFSPEELARYAFVMESQNRALRDKLTGLKEVNAELEDLAFVDHVTKANQHRVFDDHYERRREKGDSYGVIAVDIDKFGPFNKKYGKRFGDLVLKKVVEAMRKSLREGEVYRVGGEEFAVILSDVGEKETYAVAERLRKAVEDVRLKDDEDNEVGVTVSMGIAAYPSTLPCMRDQSVKDLYELADRGCRVSKKTGRNRTYFAGCFKEFVKEVLNGGV